MEINSNAAGILAGALEAAAAGAAGIGIEYGGSAQQTLNLVSSALTLASVGTNMGSDFASGKLAQGLVDSLNLYLPAEALANASSQTNLTDVSAGLEQEYQAVNAAYTQYYANQSAPTSADNANAQAANVDQTTAARDAGTAIGNAVQQGLTQPLTAAANNGALAAGITINIPAFAAAVMAAGTAGVTNYGSAIGQLSVAATLPSGDNTSETVSEGDTVVKVTVSDNPAGSGSPSQIGVTAQVVNVTPPSTSDTIQAWVKGIANDAISFFGIGMAVAA